MFPKKSLFLVCCALASLCLFAGFLSLGNWPGALCALASGLAWLLARKYKVSGAALACLLACSGLAVAGVLSGAPPVLMICAVGLALAAWDMLALDAALAGISSTEQTRLYEKDHLSALALALGAGLLLALLGRLLSLRMPFVLLLFLAALAVFGLERVWNILKKRSRS